MTLIKHNFDVDKSETKSTLQHSFTSKLKVNVVAMHVCHDNRFTNNFVEPLSLYVLLL